MNHVVRLAPALKGDNSNNFAGSASTAYSYRHCLFACVLLFCSVCSFGEQQALAALSPTVQLQKKVTLSAAHQDWLRKHPHIRLGQPQEVQPYIFVDEQGRSSGIAVDLATILNDRLGTHIEVVSGAYSDLAQQVLSKQLDGLMVVSAQVALADPGQLVTSQPHLSTSLALFARRDEPTSITRKQDIKNKHLAYIEGLPNSVLWLADIQNANQVSPANNSIQCLKLVAESKVDYCLTLSSDQFYVNKHRLINVAIKYLDLDNVIPLFTAVRADWPELAEIINVGLQSIDGAHLNQIVGRWTDPYDALQGQAISQDEQKWLNSIEQLKIATSSSWQPFNVPGKTKALSGLTRDYTQILEEQISIEFSVTAVDNWHQALALLKEGELDLIPGLPITETSKNEVTFSAPIDKVPLILVDRQDMPFVQGIDDFKGKTLTVLKNSASHNILSSNFPEQLDG
jgi:ABC-type amino acid transport substrate-binding protein